MTPKTIKSDPKLSTKSSNSQNIHFSTLPHPPKIFIEIQEFELQKWTQPTYVWKYQSTPPPGTGPVYMSTKYQGKL